MTQLKIKFSFAAVTVLYLMTWLQARVSVEQVQEVVAAKLAASWGGQTQGWKEIVFNECLYIYTSLEAGDEVGLGLRDGGKSQDQENAEEEGVGHHLGS